MKKKTCNICSLAAVISTLFLGGCATEQPLNSPVVWQQVRPGMQKEQVHMLLGAPTHQDLGGAEEVYIYTMQESHTELHVQYDAGGTVCAKRYNFVQ